MRILMFSAIATSVTFLAGGCPNATRTEFPTNFLEANRFIQDTSLTPQERREQIRLLGITDSVINALMLDTRLGNQFGGDLRSAYDKVTGNGYQRLTPDEVQFFGDEATDVSASVDATLDDEEAQAIVNLFQDESLNNSADLATFLADPANSVKIPDAIPDGVLEDLFVDFDTDLLIERLP
ncbi:MAG: hypothetical protein AB7N71_11350 [Phycisphaerae bacterium]